MALHLRSHGRPHGQCGAGLFRRRNTRPWDLRPDGTVDLAASLTRELNEETGLHEGYYIVSDEWIVVHAGQPSR